MTSSTTQRPAPLHADFGLTVVSDVGCPWARVAVHRVRRELQDRGLDDELPLDHRAFPLELVNDGPLPRPKLAHDIEACERLEPELAWPPPPDDWTFPVSTLPALQAVRAAKQQGVEASDALDRALRDAIFAEWRCVSVFPIVFEIAATVPEVDVDLLRDELASGRPHTEIWSDLDRLVDEVPGSPTFVLPDGSIVHHPGVELRHGDDGAEVVEDDRDAITDLVTRALATQRAD